MLRRRIFSSAMASVMALSAVAVVANAEETTNQYKSEADLKDLLKDYDDAWRVETLSDYGTEMTQMVLNALDAAEVILADADSDYDDYTVAYNMVEATVAKLKNRTLEELLALIESSKAIIDAGNVLNPELLDLKYTPDSFFALEEELATAEYYKSSTHPADINDAVIRLEADYNALSLMPTVTKSQYRTALAEYNAIFENEFDYESWRRGSMPWTDFNLFKGDASKAWAICNSDDYAGMAYAAAYGLTTGAKEAITTAYSEIDGIKGLTMTSDEEIYDGYMMLLDAIKLYNNWTVDSVGRASKAGVSQLLKQYHNQLVYDYAPDGTSVDDLYNAIAAIANMEVQTFGEEGVDDVWHVERTTIGKDHKITKIYAEAIVKLKGSSVFIPVDTEGYWTGNVADIVTSRDAKKDGVTYKAIYESVKFNLADLIKVSADDCVAKADKDFGHEDDNIRSLESEVAPTIFGDFYKMNWVEEPVGSGTWVIETDGNGDVLGNAWAWDCDPVLLSNAMVLAEAYTNEQWAADDVVAIFKDLDDTAIVRKNETPTGATTEWALVYRYLKYALEDKYTSKAVTTEGKHYTKADIRALIEKSTKLVDATGDAAIFRASNVNLDTEIKVAYDWLGQADTDKMYRDGAQGMDADGFTYADSDSVYKRLESFYNQLTKEEAALKYEFGTIYDDIARICEAMDNGDLEPTQTLIEAVDACAYALAGVDPITYVTAGGEVCPDGKYHDNAAFNDVKKFIEINRCVTVTGENAYIVELDGQLTDANKSHLALAKAYEALLKAEKDQTAEPEFKAGDADGDGEVTTIDAGLILQYAAKMITLEDLKGNGDRDGDGDVTALDAAQILIDKTTV